MVYARVSKTRGCNDLESSSLSPGTYFLEEYYYCKFPQKTPISSHANTDNV